MESNEPKGIIGKSYKDGLPIIWKFVNELPEESIREKLQNLVVILWEYDGSQNNGMPSKEINNQMIELESAIEDKISRESFLHHAYSKTGNNSKELVYYAHDTDQFMEKLNQALSENPRYPLDISFYEDSEWGDIQNVLSLFNK